MYTYDEVIYSDLFKDANGWRPRNDFYEESTTPERKQQLWDEMLKDLKRANEELDKKIADREQFNDDNEVPF